MSSPWIKICANTNLADSLLAADLGADALGFVFAPSVRQVNAAQVRPIADALPRHVERIGVFARFSAEAIAEAVFEADLTGVQLHDGFDPVVTARLRELLPANITLIQTAHWAIGSPGSLAGVTAAIGKIPDGSRALIDAKVGSVSGGTGVTFDWNAATAVFQHPGSLKMILAGGLNPGNVAEAIKTLRPWGVDLASGVEASPGRKDPAKLAAFIKNARTA